MIMKAYSPRRSAVHGLEHKQRSVHEARASLLVLRIEVRITAHGPRHDMKERQNGGSPKRFWPLGLESFLGVQFKEWHYALGHQYTRSSH